MPTPISRLHYHNPPDFYYPQYMLTGFWWVEETDASGMPVKCSLVGVNGFINLVFSGEWRITSGEDDPGMVERWGEWMIVWWG